MALFAEVENNIVTQVIVADQAFIDNLEGTWIETAMDGSIRNTYAGVGWIYKPEKDIFVFPQPYDSWVFNEETSKWQAPIPYPTEDITKEYDWNETTHSWDLIA